MTTEQTKDRRQETLRNNAAGIAASGTATADMPLRPDVALGLWMSWMETNFGKAQDWTGTAKPWWGLADLAPADAKKGGDKRFAAPEWHENPVYRTLKEMYLLLDVLTHRHQIQQTNRLAESDHLQGRSHPGRTQKRKFDMRSLRYVSIFALAATVSIASPHDGKADALSLEAAVREKTASIEGKLIAWRRDIHQHPELGDQETRTSGIVAEHLRSLGLEVRTGVARTGVVAVLKGAKPGPTVALRADMDALPVKEPKGLPFASVAKGRHLGKEVDVMHACGHDAHTAMLMAAAEVLTSLRDQLPGTVQFIFQPAEEGSSLYPSSSGEISGAKLMVKEGIFAETRPDAVFGLHVMLGKSGEIAYRAGAVLASSDNLEIRVTGKQGHGGMPWRTIDPITTSALIVNGLQTIVSRKVDLTTSPAVVTIGTINGGTRANIVPETVEMTGTIRTYDEAIRSQIHRDIANAAGKIAESAGATAEVSVSRGYDTTVNNEELTERMLPVLERVADGRIRRSLPVGASEDFSVFAQQAPGLFVFLGITPEDQDPVQAAPNHSPNFLVDESALVVGARTMASLAVNYLATSPGK